MRYWSGHDWRQLRNSASSPATTISRIFPPASPPPLPKPLARSQRSAEVDELPYNPEHRGYYLKTARILGTDADGSLLYEIHAEEAFQEAQDRIEFTNVRIRYSPSSDVTMSGRVRC